MYCSKLTSSSVVTTVQLALAWNENWSGWVATRQVVMCGLVCQAAKPQFQFVQFVVLVMFAHIWLKEMSGSLIWLLETGTMGHGPVSENQHYFPTAELPLKNFVAHSWNRG